MLTASSIFISHIKEMNNMFLDIVSLIVISIFIFIVTMLLIELILNIIITLLKLIIRFVANKKGIDVDKYVSNINTKNKLDSQLYNDVILLFNIIVETTVKHKFYGRGLLGLIFDFDESEHSVCVTKSQYDSCMAGDKITLSANVFHALKESDTASENGIHISPTDKIEWTLISKD